MPVENVLPNHPETTATVPVADGGTARTRWRKALRWLIAPGVVAWILLSVWMVDTGMHLPELRARQTMQRFFDALQAGDYDTAEELAGLDTPIPKQDLVGWGIRLQHFTITVRDTEMTRDYSAVIVTVDFTDPAGSTHSAQYRVAGTHAGWNIQGFDPEDP